MGAALGIGFEEALIGAVETFMLVFVRMTGMFAVSPIFGRRNLPTYYKIGLAFFLALLLTASGAPAMPQTGGTPLEYALLALTELMVGISIGFIPYLMFSAIYLAGQLIDMKIGFSMVSVLDPVSNLQIPVTSNFYFILCMLVFITVNAHHSVIRAIYESYAFVPAGTLSISRGVVDGLFRLFSDIFVLGFRMAAPIVFTVLLTDVALGIISKAMPQMNVFMVGMPLKILVGLIIIIVTLPAMMLILGELFRNVELETANFMRGIGAQ
ncbi:MAG: flagellar type III secretion system protein FliR [Clostridiales bacterium]|nr:flagellar type III secretion system protein FliR [Clostridiales bacterium]